MLLRGVGTLRYVFSPPDAPVQWQPDGLTVHAKKWSLGAGFLGAPPISLTRTRAPGARLQESATTCVGRGRDSGSCRCGQFSEFQIERLKSGKKDVAYLSVLSQI